MEIVIYNKLFIKNDCNQDDYRTLETKFMNYKNLKLSLIVEAHTSLTHHLRKAYIYVNNILSVYKISSGYLMLDVNIAQ